MAKYNIDALSFLIGSFRDCVASYGQSNKTVEFYKRNVMGLVSTNQVSAMDAELIERVVGMQNTNAVKWEQADKNISQFVNAMNAIMKCNGDKNKIAYTIKSASAHGKISDKIKSILLDVFEIKDNGFGTDLNTPKEYTNEHPKADETPIGVNHNGKIVTNINLIGKGLGMVYNTITNLCLDLAAQGINKDKIVIMASYRREKYKCSFSDLALDRNMVRDISSAISNGGIGQIGVLTSAGYKKATDINVKERKSERHTSPQEDMTYNSKQFKHLNVTEAYEQILALAYSWKKYMDNINSHESIIIRVKNPDTVHSGDSQYFNYDLNTILVQEGTTTDSYKLGGLLSAGNVCQIGYRLITPSPSTGKPCFRVLETVNR